jgi:hypothetical protein
VGPFASPQIHDFNPGDLNEPSQPNYFVNGGVFWTMPIPKSSLTIHPEAGDARFTVSDRAMFDYFTSVNAILRPPGLVPLDATASIEIHWTGTGECLQVENDQADFTGLYEHAGATVEWSASNDAGYFFSTANASAVNITHAFTAHVRNGSFYP